MIKVLSTGREKFVEVASCYYISMHIIIPCRCFKDDDHKSILSVPVGNVTDTTELIYEFTNTKSNVFFFTLLVF